uniref:S.cerevisiae 39kb DNA segment of chromosome IV n=1 Tax=Saccharomyces cerevisiae TaxID=4932 RepID=E9PAC3_YEASX|nr:unnamed protein product [Saccharomyces cerevisiae]
MPLYCLVSKYLVLPLSTIHLRITLPSDSPSAEQQQLWNTNIWIFWPPLATLGLQTHNNFLISIALKGTQNLWHIVGSILLPVESLFVCRSQIIGSGFLAAKH